MEEGKLLLDGDCTVNVKNLRTAMGIGLRLLCSCNTIITQRHKAALRPFLDFKFHYLTHKSNLVTDELLGPNLEQKINESIKGSEVAKRLTYNKTPRDNRRFDRSQRQYSWGYRSNNFRTFYYGQNRDHREKRPDSKYDNRRGNQYRGGYRGRHPRFESARGRGTRGRR